MIQCNTLHIRLLPTYPNLQKKRVLSLTSKTVNYLHSETNSGKIFALVSEV